jgi:hypothetical protein
MFKALKQNLRIKTFVGTSANALKIQIWTALIAILLVRYLQLRSKLGWHLSRFLALLRQQLFVYRDLMRFLDQPFEGPPQPPNSYPQLPLNWAGEFGQQIVHGDQPHPINSERAAISPTLSTAAEPTLK